jgi:hypothetical protein
VDGVVVGVQDLDLDILLKDFSYVATGVSCVFLKLKDEKMREI